MIYYNNSGKRLRPTRVLLPEVRTTMMMITMMRIVAAAAAAAVAVVVVVVVVVVAVVGVVVVVVSWGRCGGREQLLSEAPGGTIRA